MKKKYREILYSGDDSYNNNLYIRESHNCYTYFLNLKSNFAYNVCKKKYLEYRRCDRPQPGYAANLEHIEKEDHNCKTVMERIHKDNHLINSTFEQPCPDTHYKGAIVVAPKRDFHFYRKNDDGVWTHKPGPTKSTYLDASNLPIKNPQLANRNYGNTLNYKDFCGFVCVPRNRTKKRMKMFQETKHYTRRKTN